MNTAAYSELLRRPIAYHPVFRKVAGSTPAAVMVSQMYYWSSEGRISAERDGWFHKTIDQWEEETGLSRSEQDRARRDLKKAGVLEEKRKGNPARMWFRLKVDALLALVAQFAESCKLKSAASDQDDAPLSGDGKQPKSTNENNSLQNHANKIAESCKQDCTSLQSSMQNPANYLTEITSEITSETTCADADASASSAPVTVHADQPANDASTDAEDPFLSNLFSPEPCETLPATTATAAPAGAGREAFEMHHDWQPSEFDVRRFMSRQVSALGLGRVQQELDLFRLHYDGAGARRHGQWVKAFVSWLNRAYPSEPAQPAVISRQQKRAAVTEAIMDINDTDW
jgi:hypothetical protein